MAKSIPGLSALARGPRPPFGNVAVFTEFAQTFTAAATNIITPAGTVAASPTSGVQGWRVSSGGTLPGGLVANTLYYVVSISANLYFALSPFVTAVADTVDITSTGAGTHTMTPVFAVPADVDRVWAEVVGGGGGGGGGGTYTGGGGGAGGSASGFLDETPGDLVDVSIGGGAVEGPPIPAAAPGVAPHLTR